MPKKKSDEQIITTAIEWRKAREEGEVVTLPSGKTARLRTLSLLRLLERGTIPDSLSGIIQEMMGGEKKVANTLETFQSLSELMALVCQLSFVYPKIVDDPQADDEINIEDVAYDDQFHVFNWSQKEIALMTPFRQKRDGDVETVPGSDDVQPEAVGTDGD